MRKQVRGRRVTVVVPCFNEELRLHPEGFLPLLEDDGWRLLFVNDGSTDGTARVLAELRQRRPEQIELLTLRANVGKSEAVRQGLLSAVAQGPEVVAYYDADLATPTDDLQRIVAAMAEPAVQMAMGSRVKLLGRDIQRSVRRHLMGRVFATLASLSLDMPVYDTQCGAKALRVTEVLKAALAQRFHSRWIFDVELIGRLRARGLDMEAFVEVPLAAWQDVRGSKLTVPAMARALGDLARIARDLRQE